MSDRKDWPPVVGEHFTQAWINLAELPGGMMQSYSPERGHFRFGPIPSFTTCAITTNPDDAKEWRARGEPVLAIYTAPPTIPADVGRRAMEALEGVIRVADRKTNEFDAARAAITELKQYLGEKN
jgi:hypothetical protein